MKLKITFILIFLITMAFAQVKVEGFVKDQAGNPLELANVVAINQETKILDTYSITNSKGRYSLNLKKQTSYQLQVNFIGMKTETMLIAIKETPITKDFNLINDTTLNEVELVYEIPIVVKKDTIVYNASSFVDKTDRKLEDVLSKLPGVEVNDDGEIEVEGKAVGKVMVEGKDFFDGDTKLATKNIPADALDKIEVLKNFDEVSQLRNVRNNEDNIAINIKLKEGKKNFWFGEITAGLGIGFDELYLAHPKLFYYSPKYSLNIITDLNNIGSVPFTRRDYFKFTGGFRGVSRNSGTTFNVESSDIGFLTLQNNRANAIESKFGAVNFNYALKKTWDLSGFAIYSGNKTQIIQNTVKTFTQDNQGNVIRENELTTNTAEQNTDLGLLKLSSTYKPNSNNRLDYDVFGRISEQTEQSDFFSSVLQNIDETQKQNPYSINQNLNYYYTLNDKNIFALETQYLIQDEDPFYNAILEVNNQFRFSETLGLNTNQSNFNVVQDQRVKTNKLDVKTDYWRVLNDRSNLNVTLGFLSSNQRFNSEIYQLLDTNSPFELSNRNTPVTNDVTYNFNDAYIGFKYTLKTGIFTLRPGLSLHNYNAKNSQLSTVFEDNFVRLLPNFNTLIQFKKSESLTFNYNLRTAFANINQLARGLVLNNYNSIFRGNNTLENSLSHNLRLNYSSFNLFNYTNIFASINYTKRIDQIRNQSAFLINTTNRVSSPFNSNFDDESLSFNGRFERTFGKIKTSLGGNFSYQKFNQFVNNQPNTNESFAQNYRSRVTSNFKNAPNFEIGYILKVNDYNQGSGNTRFYTNNPFVKMDAYFLKAFTFTSKYSYFNYRNPQETLNTYSFWDASIAYQKADTKWEYTLAVTNLLDVKSLNRDNTNTLFTSTSEYFIQPRYIVFSVKYDL